MVKKLYMRYFIEHKLKFSPKFHLTQEKNEEKNV